MMLLEVLINFCMCADMWSFYLTSMCVECAAALSVLAGLISLLDVCFPLLRTLLWCQVVLAKNLPKGEFVDVWLAAFYGKTLVGF